MADFEPHLEGLDYLGDGTRFLGQLRALIPGCALFANLAPAEAGMLAPYLDMYRCGPRTQIVGEGDSGESVLIILEGRVQVSEQDPGRATRVLGEYGPGGVLGESALIDGDPHDGNCVAIEPTLVAALRRESLARIIVEQPTLGAKILMELLGVFSARLRATRARLRAVLEGKANPPGETRQ